MDALIFDERKNLFPSLLSEAARKLYIGYKGVGGKGQVLSTSSRH